MAKTVNNQSEFDPKYERLRPAADRRIVAQQRAAREASEPEPPSYGVVDNGKS